MPHPSNAVVLAEYDLGVVATASPRILGEETDAHEWAAQCVAFEMLRLLVASLMTEQEYNDMSQEDWDTYVGNARNNADLLGVAPVDELQSHQVEGAANIGGNFFEHGYSVIMAQTQAADEIVFRKLTGLE